MSAVRAHEHFCFMCYGRSKVKGVSRGASGSGWWRCTSKKCAKARECLCKVHAAVGLTSQD